MDFQKAYSRELYLNTKKGRKEIAAVESVELNAKPSEFIPESCKSAAKLVHVDSSGATELKGNMQLLLQQQNALIASQQEQIQKIERNKKMIIQNHKGQNKKPNF